MSFARISPKFVVGGIVFALLASNASPIDLTLNGNKVATFSGQISMELQYDKVSGKTQDRPQWIYNFRFTPRVSFARIPVPLEFLVAVSSLENALHQPINRFNLHLKRPWLDMYLGDAHPTYSELTLNGILVRGGSIDLTPGKLRLGVVYGHTKRAVGQADSAVASYKRILYGGKIGFGKSRNSFIELIFFKAKDDSTSIPPPLEEIHHNGDTLVDTVETLYPQENVVLGINGQITFARNAVKLAGEFSGSALTRDTRSLPMDIPGYPKWANSILDPKLSTSADIAGRLNLDISLGSTSFSGTYRHIGAGYQSLGSPNLTNDVEGYSLNASQRLWNNRISLSAFCSNNHDNLLGQKNGTTETRLFNINLAITPEKLPYLSFSYNAYSSKNDRNDSLKADNLTNSYTVNTGIKF